MSSRLATGGALGKADPTAVLTLDERAFARPLPPLVDGHGAARAASLRPAAAAPPLRRFASLGSLCAALPELSPGAQVRVPAFVDDVVCGSASWVGGARAWDPRRVAGLLVDERGAFRGLKLRLASESAVARAYVDVGPAHVREVVPVHAPDLVEVVGRFELLVRAVGRVRALLDALVRSGSSPASRDPGVALVFDLAVSGALGGEPLRLVRLHL